MKVALLVAVGILLVGCSDNTPSKLDPGVFPATIYDDKPISLSAVALNKSGKPIPDVQITYQTNPVEIAEVSNSGELRCRSSGDATLMLNGGGQSAMANLKCRIVAKIELPKELSLVIGKVEPQFQPHVINEKGAEIPDASIGAKSADEKTVHVENGRLVPAQVGKTFVTYSAGPITTTMDVMVSKLLSEVSGPLFLADGQAKVISLQRGSYLIEIKASSQGGGLGNGVTVNSTGANCSQTESFEHMFQCDVSDTATVTITNPSAFGMGAAMSGFANISQVPSN